MDMFESLLTQSSGKRASAEMLEMLGRKASTMFQQQGIPLNDAIATVLKDHPELGNEHVKRIVEFANTVTFQEQFQNSEDKNVHFQVADPGVVLRDLKDGGSPAHDGKTLSGGMGDYNAPPQQGNTPEDQQLEAMFNAGNHQPSNEGGELAKMASAPADQSLHANPYEDVYDSHVRLQAARSELAGAHERFDMMAKEAEADLERLVKHEALAEDGAGLAGVLHVLQKVASEELVAAVITPMVEKFAQDRLSQSRLEAGLEKKAGRVVNTNHPLLGAWSGLVKAAQDKVRTQMAIEELDASLAETTAFLKQAGCVTTGVKKAMGGKGTVMPAVRQRMARR